MSSEPAVLGTHLRRSVYGTSVIVTLAVDGARTLSAHQPHSAAIGRVAIVRRW